MTKEEKIKAIKAIEAWQADSTIHELTCGVSSNHKPLVPVEKGDDVVLLCVTCGYFQKWIPDVVFKRWTQTKPK